MIKEIEVEGVGVMRHCNDWQVSRIKRMPNRRNRSFAWVAFGLGMTLQQFKSLTIEQQRAAFDAHAQLTSSCSIASDKPPVSTAPQRWQRLSLEQQVSIGLKLLEVKSRLPRGHFMQWIEVNSGMSYTQALRYIKAAERYSRLEANEVD